MSNLLKDHRIRRERINTAVGAGTDAFWRTVKGYFPEIRDSGKLSVLAEMEANKKLKELVADWLHQNTK